MRISAQSIGKQAVQRDPAMQIRSVAIPNNGTFNSKDREKCLDTVVSQSCTHCSHLRGPGAVTVPPKYSIEWEGVFRFPNTAPAHSSGAML